MRSLVRILVCLFAASVSAAAIAQADGYPNKTIRMVVGFSPGGFTDVLARVIAQKLHERLGQPVIVENKAGVRHHCRRRHRQVQAGRLQPINGPCDSSSVAPAMYPNLPYDVIKDFTPIVRVASTPLLLTLHPSVPANDVQSFIALARKKDANLRFASPGNGSAEHLAAEQFMLMTASSNGI